MSWISSLKYNAALIQYRRILKNFPGTHDFVSFDKCREICLMANPASREEAQIILHLILSLNKEKKNTHLYHFRMDKKKEIDIPTSIPVTMITPEHLNWIGCPKKIVQDVFVNQTFDICIDLVDSDRIFSGYLCGISRARMRAGLYKRNCDLFYDFIVKPGAEMDLGNKINEIMNFLKMIN